MLFSPQLIAPTQRPAVSTVFPVTSGQNFLVRAQDIVSADRTAVATWSDTAGIGPYDLTQATAGTRPIYVSSGANDALPYVAFDQTAGKTLENAIYPLDKRAGSFFFVVDWNTLSTAKYALGFGGGITLLWAMDTDSDFKRYVAGFTTVVLNKMPTGRRVAILITFGATANKVYIDASANVASLSALAAGSITDVYLGGSANALNKMYEARGWNRELSAGEAAQILDTWAPAVYGTGAAATTPSGRVITDGDSITAGTGTATTGNKSINWPYYLNPGNSWFGYNYAVSGNTWANLITRQAVTNTFANSSNYLIVNAGTNDIGNGRTAAQIETDFATYMNAAVAAGFVKAKIAVTTLAVSNMGAGGTARNDFNTWLRANYTTYAGVLLDIQADATLGSSLAGTPNTPAIYDGTHYTEAGYAAYASFVRTGLGAVPF